MNFPAFLKEQLNSFVDCYKNHFRQTFGIAVSFTILCFISAALLFRFANFDGTINGRQISLLSYFFTRYSEGDTYSIVDLMKIIFLFFVSLFCVTLNRLGNDKAGGSELTFAHSFGALRFNAVLILVFVLFILCLIDYYLFQAQTYFITGVSRTNVALYLKSLFFHLRIYLPLIVFSIAIWSVIAVQKSRITLKRILWLYITLWLCNETAFEFSGWVRVHLFALILLPVKDGENYYLFESILGVPLIACFFLAYYAAMTMPLILTEKIDDSGTQDVSS